MKYLILLLGLGFALSAYSKEDNVVKTFTIDAFNAEYLLFDNQVLIGKRNNKITLSGKGLSKVKKTIAENKSSFNDVEFNEERQCYETSYIKHRIIDFTFNKVKYRVKIELIQVDWPENEIAWKMIPKYTLIKLD